MKVNAVKGSGDMKKPTSSAFKDKSKPANIRSCNITAAKGEWIHLIIVFISSFWLFIYRILSDFSPTSVFDLVSFSTVGNLCPNLYDLHC